MKTVNIGIIGVGRWGLNYLRTFNELEDASVKWICSRKEATLKEALNKVELKYSVKTTTNYRDILKDKEVDAVAIVSDGSTHYKFAKETLQSNKHVIVEKPLAFHSKDVKELIRISNKKNKILMVGHLHLFNPSIRQLKKDIKAGLFGKINFIYSFGAGNGPIREDMSALWDYFPHDISILLYILEKYPISVSANGASYIKKGVEDIVTMNIRFPNNIFAVAFGSWLYPVKKRELTIVGEKRYATFDDYAIAEKLKYFYTKPIIGNKVNSNYKVPKIKNVKPLTEQIKHFLNCIKNNIKPLTDVYEGLKVVSILEAAHKSLKNNGLTIRF